MIYLLTGSFEEAVYCAQTYQLKDWQFASEITNRSSGQLWLYGDYLKNPHYEVIRERSRILHLVEVNKNQ